MNKVVKITAETDVPVDPLEASIRTSITEVNAMRERLDRQALDIVSLQREVAMLQSEKQSLILVLDHERTERAYYHRFSVEVSAGMGLIGQVIDDVVTKAQKAAIRDDGKRGSDLPDLEIPKFLLRPLEPAEAQTSA